MKWYQFFILWASAYIAPHTSHSVAMVMAVILTVCGFVALINKQ